jgi:hypothetical protein
MLTLALVCARRPIRGGTKGGTLMRLTKIVAAVPAIAMLAFAGLAPNHAEAQGPVIVNIDPQVGNLIALA